MNDKLKILDEVETHLGVPEEETIKIIGFSDVSSVPAPINMTSEAEAQKRVENSPLKHLLEKNGAKNANPSLAD